MLTSCEYGYKYIMRVCICLMSASMVNVSCEYDLYNISCEYDSLFSMRVCLSMCCSMRVSDYIQVCEYGYAYNVTCAV